MRVAATLQLERLERQQQQLTDRFLHHEQIFERLVGSEKPSGGRDSAGSLGQLSQVLSIVAFRLCVYKLSS